MRQIVWLKQRAAEKNMAMSTFAAAVFESMMLAEVEAAMAEEEEEESEDLEPQGAFGSENNG